MDRIEMDPPADLTPMTYCYALEQIENEGRQKPYILRVPYDWGTTNDAYRVPWYSAEKWAQIETNIRLSANIIKKMCRADGITMVEDKDLGDDAWVLEGDVYEFHSEGA